MYLHEMKNKLNTDEYNFLRENKHLGNNIILLALGGSYAYGTNVEGSDVDVRGCALNSKRELLTNENFNQVEDSKTDTVIYSFNKLVHLLTNANPNVIEMLGNKAEHYLYVSSIGQELLDNANLFLSKKVINSFGGYANSQLHRLNNKAVREVGQSDNEKHILKTIEHARCSFAEKYFDVPEDAIHLYVDKAVQDGYDTEIFMDVQLKKYPLRDYKAMWSEMQTIVKSYSKIGKRNEHAMVHDKLGKHMMHIIRLYIMSIDILENQRIVTYIEKEHDLLMDIRNGKYLDRNKQPTLEFFEMVNEFEKKFDYAKEHTCLPNKPDYNKIAEFVVSVNERIVKGEV